jgi:DNA-binding MarR family transcriptional regulator
MPVELVRLVWTLHRILRQRQTPPTGEIPRPPAQIEVLRLVDSRPGISVREVAGALGMRPNNVSTLVSQLSRDGFLERRIGAQDKRVVELHPTERMVAAADEVNESLHELITKALDELPPEASDRIAAALPDLWRLARTLTPPP